MPELDVFDARLEAAVHAFADRAETRVDAAAVAERAIGHRRTGVWAVLDRSVPIPVSLLILLGLLLGIVMMSLGGGAPWDRQLGVVPVPSLSSASPSPVPSPSPSRTTDGQGPEIVNGTETIAITAQPTERIVASTRQFRGGVAAVAAAANDPRVSGTGTWQFDRDVYAAVATEWGTYHLQNDAGAWDGACSGGISNAGDAAARTCWLTGSKAYAGYTYYFVVTQTALGSGAVEGVIYPGSPVGP